MKSIRNIKFTIKVLTYNITIFSLLASLAFLGYLVFLWKDANEIIFSDIPKDIREEWKEYKEGLV